MEKQTKFKTAQTLYCRVCEKPFTPRCNNQKFCCEECKNEWKTQLLKSRCFAFGGERTLEKMSGDELLHYGKIQAKKQIEALKKGGKK